MFLQLLMLALLFLLVEPAYMVLCGVEVYRGVEEPPVWPGSAESQRPAHTHAHAHAHTHTHTETHTHTHTQKHTHVSSLFSPVSPGDTALRTRSIL